MMTSVILWAPIESRRQDMTVLIVVEPTEGNQTTDREPKVFPAYIDESLRVCDPGTWEPDSGLDGDFWQATLWAPLPAAPRPIDKLGLAGDGPFAAVPTASNPKIIDRHSRPRFFVIPAAGDPSEPMEAAEAAARALNDGLGFPRPPIEAPLDPQHIRAAKATDRPYPKAAE